MKGFLRLIAACLAFGLLSVSGASAAPVTAFDAGARNGVNGLRISDIGWIGSAADFELNDSLPVTGAEIWTIEYPGMFQWSGTLNYDVYADAAGAPVGPPLYSGSVGALRQSDPLADCCGYDEFSYTFSFASPLQLQAHTRYWLAVNLPGGGTFSTTQAFWAGATTTFDSAARLVFDPVTAASTGYPFDLAFRLFSDATDTTPPTVHVPAAVTVDATGPTGADVTYSVSAVDNTDAHPSLQCSPQNGSHYPIGDTTTTCTATDATGNSASASFVVHVRGAAEQLTNLASGVATLGPGNSLAAVVAQAQAALGRGQKAVASDILAGFVKLVSAQSGKMIAPGTAATLIDTATRLRTVLG